jgi:protein tyrosine/serine phosphatase
MTLTGSFLRKFLLLILTGCRLAATAILGRTVLLPRGLVGLGHDTLSASQAELHRIFTHLSTASAYPTLIHCTQGKDRTGLVIVLLLLLLLLPPDDGEEEDASSTADRATRLTAIAHDYHLSEPALQAEMDERMREIRAIGLTDEFAGCPAGFTREVKQYLDEGYGGVRGYLGAIGVGEEMQEQVRGLLLYVA